MKDFHFDAVSAFENYEIKEMKDGHVEVSSNYLKAGKRDDVLTIKGECVHQGRTTCVVDVDISNQEGKNVCKATFTMFVTGQRSDERQVRI